MSDLSEMFEVVEGCCLHDPVWRPDDVEREISWTGDRQNGSDSSSTVIVRLKDKTYGLFTQNEDYTGHGCVCNSFTAKEPTLAKLLAHLDDYDLEAVLSR